MPEIVILGTHNTIDHTSPLLQYFGERAVVEPDWRPSTIMAHHPALVITFDESQPERGLCIAEMARQGVPTLLIMDGIPEWRNTWVRARDSSARPLNQPIFAHKVACLGRADARLYESWGNLGKCEVVGSPRLDPIIALNRSLRVEPVKDRSLRLLVMTAKTPGFTKQEVERTFQSLLDLWDYLSKRDNIQVLWRVTAGLHKRLGVKNKLTEASTGELKDVLAMVDAVITTPSTAMLEAMLFGHPVALLDYHNCPHYIPAAWRISSKEHIESSVEDLRQAPLERMLYQDYCLKDALSCISPALPRMINLIETMIKLRQQQLSSGRQELKFPLRILTDPEDLVYLPNPAFDLHALYPKHPIFARQDLIAMQAELEAAIQTVDGLKNQVNLLTRRLHGIPGYNLAKRLVKSLEKLVS